MRLSRLISLAWLRTPASRTLAWERRFHAARTAHGEDRLGDAEAEYAAALREAEGFAPGDPRRFVTLSSYAGLLRLQGREGEAEPLCLQALRLKEALYGPAHPDVAATLKDLVDVYRAQGKSAEARACYARAVAILEKAIGPDLPDLAESLERSGLGGPSRGSSPEAPAGAPPERSGKSDSPV